jgi:hypothetical protein
MVAMPTVNVDLSSFNDHSEVAARRRSYMNEQDGPSWPTCISALKNAVFKASHPSAVGTSMCQFTWWRRLELVGAAQAKAAVMKDPKGRN